MAHIQHRAIKSYQVPAKTRIRRLLHLPAGQSITLHSCQSEAQQQLHKTVTNITWVNNGATVMKDKKFFILKAKVSSNVAESLVSGT